MFITGSAGNSYNMSSRGGTPGKSFSRPKRTLEQNCSLPVNIQAKSFGNKVLWKDGSKITWPNSTNSRLVWCRPKAAFHEKNLKPASKHRDENILTARLSAFHATILHHVAKRRKIIWGHANWSAESQNHTTNKAKWLMKHKHAHFCKPDKRGFIFQNI